MTKTLWQEIEHIENAVSDDINHLRPVSVEQLNQLDMAVKQLSHLSLTVRHYQALIQNKEAVREEE